MSNVTPLSLKTLASKRRVSDMARSTVAYLDEAARLATERTEKRAQEKVVLDQLQLAFRKVYAVLGPDAAERHVPWVQSIVRETYKREG